MHRIEASHSLNSYCPQQQEEKNLQSTLFMDGQFAWGGILLTNTLEDLRLKGKTQKINAGDLEHLVS